MAQTAWTAPLLGDAGRADAAPLRRAVVVFMGIALFSGFGFVTLLPSNDATSKDASGDTQSQLATINATLTDDAVSTQLCWPNSGGTCRFFSCHGDRGPTFCYDALCLCQPGSCAGPDGVCYAGQNTPVGSGVKFRNEQFPSMYLQLNEDVEKGMHYLGIGSDGTAFDLTRFIGSGDKVTVNFATGDLPDMMMRVDPRHKRTLSNPKPYGDDPMLQTPNEAWDKAGFWPLAMGGDAYAFTLKVVKDSPQTVTIESRQFEGRYLFADGSNFVSTVKTMIVDPGSQGHWIAEPPLTLDPAAS